MPIYKVTKINTTAWKGFHRQISKEGFKEKPIGKIYKCKEAQI